MDIKEAQKDLKKRQEALVEELNQVMSQRQQLEARFKALIKEADMLNGEGRMLKRLDGDKPSKK